MVLKFSKNAGANNKATTGRRRQFLHERQMRGDALQEPPAGFRPLSQQRRFKTIPGIATVTYLPVDWLWPEGICGASQNRSGTELCGG